MERYLHFHGAVPDALTSSRPVHLIAPMKKQIALLAALSGFIMPVAGAAEPVTPDNYRRAETDFNFKKKVDEGMFGKFGHVREPAPIDKQLVVRVNRDTLFSWAVFDLSEPVTIVKPDTGKRFQSMLVVNEDHYIKLVAYEPGEYLLTRGKIGTRYVQLVARTFVNPNDPADIESMVQLLDRDGYDLVCGWRKDRKDAFLSRLLPSMLATNLASLARSDGSHWSPAKKRSHLSAFVTAALWHTSARPTCATPSALR